MTRGDRPQVTFFFPYHEVAGVPVLFARMAAELAKDHSRAVRVIDYPNGYQARTLAGVANVELTPFADGVPVRVGPGEHLVMQGILPSTIRRELQPDPETRLFFWVLHPFNFIQTIIPTAWGRDFQARHSDWNRRVLKWAMSSHVKTVGTFIDSIHRHDALAFMDGTTLDSTTRRLGIELTNPVMLPVPVDTPATMPTQTRRRAGEPLTVAWVGRLSDFKIHILTYTITRLSRWADTRKEPMTMLIIGDGPDAHAIRALSRDSGYLRLEFLGSLSPAALDQTLLERSDLLVAMGTSALEGARLGIPTVLLDIAYGPIRGDYRFKWLFETQRFELGHFVTEADYEPENRSLERMLTELSSDWYRLAQQTYSYCVENHSLASIANRFRLLVDRSDLRWADLTPDIRRKTPIRQTYEWLRAAARSRHTPHGTPRP